MNENVSSKANELSHIKGYDYIEFYVGNAYQAAHFYRTTFGFNIVACAELDPKSRDRVSFIAEQGQMRLLLTTALDPDSPVAEHVRMHGDGVKDIAFTVNNAASAFDEAVKRGARAVMEPTELKDQHGRLVKATIAAFGDCVHSFIERKDYRSPLLPHYRTSHSFPPARTAALTAFDHVAVSVEAGKMNYWVEFYQNVLGFRVSHQEDIATEYSGMNSKVVESTNSSVKFPIIEPVSGMRRSQVEEYLIYHRGPGVQHIGLLSEDILETVPTLRANGIEFLPTPDIYYEMLQERIGDVGENIPALRQQSVLIDRDAWGYLLQVFTKPVQDRPTIFWEIIQRKEARGFGGGNIKALYEAVEREQQVRWNA